MTFCLDGLILLNTISSGNNQEVQKIIAFEGAFEKLFTIAINEGGNMGGTDVASCLDVVHNLIKNNQSNRVT